MDTREFHISRRSREIYECDDCLFSLRGNVVFADLGAVKRLAAAMNRRRDIAAHPERSVRPGALNAMGLIDEILHYVVALYLRGSGLAEEWERRLARALGQEALDELLLQFTIEFPPMSVYRGGMEPAVYVADAEARRASIEELLLLWLANANPAFGPFGELFDDVRLRSRTAYLKAVEATTAFFRTKPGFGPFDQSLVDMLRAPAVASPYSLRGQLDYIRRYWGPLLGPFMERLLRGMDYIGEEEKIRFGGPGPAHVLEFGGLDEEHARFSRDSDWMPNLVLIAKSTLVWLDQLSRGHGRLIDRLDLVPDEELDRLAARGITGLWLIGLWERSAASRRIKEICGNAEAASSAYSLYDYEIACGLGGAEALDNLRARAWRRGIRLASDMVPNHTGIDSRWVHEHPDWFIQSSVPPFPSYSFNGHDLSSRGDVGIFLEDHYYSRDDAAVVFKRVHRPSGDTRYIYHGNDGTHMPWNDTAQLDYLNPEVREAVIRTILHVARQFPVIRFDAAMTLAKKHFQRLWYPEPGCGGDIPSRAERGLSRAEFNRRMPVEFWREVVDRVAAEAPDTLLLAEAFWMMEGYFVRTLGMHRVYNSAFMNMLKNEENEKYRTTIKNTQEFDRNILKRFVNFMNNPDEETAIAQFGDGDKYFGVCTLMCTMPGLPMFGHGQIEGFTEKYGMEFRRAYRDERPNAALIARHEAEIFPLLKRRRLFAEVENFFLYDFYREDGAVNENVFVFSNGLGAERALVAYNNSLERAWGRIRLSAAYARAKDTGERMLERRSLADAFGLHDAEDRFCLLREQRSGLWFVRSSREVHAEGLFFNLAGYECQVCLDIYEVQDNSSGHYAELCARLAGAGVGDPQAAVREIAFAPVYLPLRALLDELLASCAAPKSPSVTVRRSTGTRARGERGSPVPGEIPADPGGALDRAALDFSAAVASYRSGCRWSADGLSARVTALSAAAAARPELHSALAPLACSEALVRFSDCAWEGWELDREIADRLRRAGRVCSAAALRLIADASKLPVGGDIAALLRRFFGLPEAQAFLGFNRYAGRLFFNREAFIEAFSWLNLLCAAASCGASLHENAVLSAAEEAGYDVDSFLILIASTRKPAARTKKASGTRKTSSQAAKASGGGKPAVRGEKATGAAGRTAGEARAGRGRKSG